MDLPRKRGILVALVLGAVVVGTGGVFASAFVRSPQQEAADRQAPEPSVLTASVERRVLSDTVVVRGEVAVAGTFAVRPGVSADGQAVVTAVRTEEGAEVSAGQALIEVSGRPVFVLPGTVPAYRDLLPGAEGDDVAQLQSALTGLGFETGADDEGVFGAGTKDAVNDYYESIGYAAPSTGDEAEVKAAQDALTAAERALVQAQRDLQRLEEAADEAREQARSDTRPTRSVHAGGDPDEADDSGEIGGTGSGANSGQVESGIDVGLDQPPPVSEVDEDALDDARYQVGLAEEDLADARRSRDEAVRASGPMVPLSEFVFAPAMPALVHDIAVGVGDVVADTAVTLSTGDLVVSTRIDGERRDLLDVDMPVEILAEHRELALPGVISAIGDFTDDEEQGPGHTVAVEPLEELPQELAGETVRVTITAASTGKEVLVVPLSAVTASADGTTVVVKARSDGTQERVVVAAGVSGDGFVEIAPQTGSALDEGDTVVVGAW